MKLPFTVAIIFVFLAPSGFASEGLFYFAAYQRNAVDVNKQMVEVCVTEFPNSNKKAASAYASWLSRVSSHAAKAASECKSVWSKHEVQENGVKSASDITTFSKKITEATNQMVEAFRAKVRAKGNSVCDETFHQLETGSPLVDVQ